jgi:hypothetical protein
MRMWFMSYTHTKQFASRPRDVLVGMCVSKEHPLITVQRWQEMYRRHRDNSPETQPTVSIVLTHYARLSEQEQQELSAAGIDLTAVDVETML